MNYKYLIAVFVLLAFLSCKTKKAPITKTPIHTGNKRNFQSLATKGKKLIDTTKIIEYQEEASKNIKENQDGQNELKILQKHNEINETKIQEEFIGGSLTFATKWNNRIAKKNKELNNRVISIKKQLEANAELLTVSYCNKITDSIAKVLYIECVNKHGEPIDDEMEFAYANKLKNRVNIFFEKIRNQNSDLKKEQRILMHTATSLAYENAFIETNTRHSYLTWNLQNLSRFKTIDTKLLPAEEHSRENDYSRYIDSVVASINRINAQYNNDSSGVKIKKVKLYVFIDGYSDSQQYKDNLKLSKERAKEIEAIFISVFLKKMIALKKAYIIFSDPKFETKGHGEEKPKLEKYIDFKPDGQPDANRRLTIIKCVFYPERN